MRICDKCTRQPVDHVTLSLRSLGKSYMEESCDLCPACRDKLVSELQSAFNNTQPLRNVEKFQEARRGSNN